MQTLTGSQQALVADFTALVDGRTGLERQAVFTRLRAELPMFRSDRLDAWVVSRHADIKTVLNSENLYQPPQAGAGASAFGRSFMQMSGREHSKKVGIVARARCARSARCASA